jgi:uncharacterized peroxidase-related enzyme
MARIPAVNRNEATEPLATTFNTVKAKIGMVPNLYATFAQSPAVLDAYLAFSTALTKGQLTGAQREVLALAIGQTNQCQYCLSAHSLLAKGAGLNPEAIKSARNGSSPDPLNDALARFAVKVVQQRGVLSDEEFNAARAEGLSDALIIEVIAHVALNTLTNYTNHIAATDIDFPLVQL